MCNENKLTFLKIFCVIEMHGSRYDFKILIGLKWSLNYEQEKLTNIVYLDINFFIKYFLDEILLNIDKVEK